jgi:hypothetical protein
MLSWECSGPSSFGPRWTALRYRTWPTASRRRTHPSPAPGHCGSCRFVAPCLALERGGDVAAALEGGYRDRGPERVEPGRLGSATWGTGRGAAPPRFDAP